MAAPGDDVFVESSGSSYKLASLADFRRFRDRVTDTDGWLEKYNHEGTEVYIRQSPADGPGAGLNIVKVIARYPTLSIEAMYDALHDADFRKSWDFNMMDGYNICMLDARNDIGYYAAKFPFPLSNRDFVNQRMWMEFDNGEYVIMNYSVKHNDAPPKKGFVRGLSYQTGYYLQPLEDGGCSIHYLTHSDPQGSIPYAVLNSATTRMAPSLFEKMGKNGATYVQWSKENHPANFVAPWRTPKVAWEADLQPRASPATLLAVGGEVGEGDAAMAPVPPQDEAAAALRGSNRQSVDLSAAEARSASLAPVAPRNADDCDAIQQYRALMDDACRFVDEQFITQGRAPTLEEYLTRLHAILDAMRPTSGANATARPPIKRMVA